MQPKFILDAQMKDGFRFTSFSDTMTELATDFSCWFESQNKDLTRLWYADLYSFENGKRLAYIQPNASGFDIVQVDKTDRVRAFKRSHLMAWLRGELK